MQFKTHTGDIITGQRLTLALEQVANEWEASARAIFDDDGYATHVTLKAKLDHLNYGIALANDIRNGTNLNNFTVWQFVNHKLTNETIALMH